MGHSQSSAKFLKALQEHLAEVGLNPIYLGPGFIEIGRALEKDQVITPCRDTLLSTWKLVSFSALLNSGKLLIQWLKQQQDYYCMI